MYNSFFKKGKHAFKAMNTLNACFDIKNVIHRELHQVQEHSDLHPSIQCFD